MDGRVCFDASHTPLLQAGGAVHILHVGLQLLESTNDLEAYSSFADRCLTNGEMGEIDFDIK